MRLKFGLLWIENDYDESEEQNIRTAAAKAGFELDIRVSKTGKDIELLAQEQQKFHLFDLILLDLNLDEGVKGDELAEKVRQLFRSTPILFYSASAKALELRERMAKGRIEGVFCAERDNFIERAGDLIADYGQTLNRLVGMRGLAMEVVAQVDNICRDVFRKFVKGELETVANNFLNEAVVSQSNKNLEDYPKLGDLAARINHPATDSMKAFKLLRVIVQKHIATLPDGTAKERLQELSLETKSYVTQVVEVRNVLGHALEKKDDKGWLINDRSGKLYMRVDDFPRYRGNFIKNLNAFQEIARILIADE